MWPGGILFSKSLALMLLATHGGRVNQDQAQRESKEKTARGKLTARSLAKMPTKLFINWIGRCVTIAKSLLSFLIIH
jgi:hypothetical protein